MCTCKSNKLTLHHRRWSTEDRADDERSVPKLRVILCAIGQNMDWRGQIDDRSQCETFHRRPANLWYCFLRETMSATLTIGPFVFIFYFVYLSVFSQSQRINQQDVCTHIERLTPLRFSYRSFLMEFIFHLNWKTSILGNIK